VTVVESDADQEAAVAGKIELHDAAPAPRASACDARDVPVRALAPVDAPELLERLARLCVPHVYLGVLAELATGSEAAAANVVLGVGLKGGEG
jgi:hypothetical protein